MMTREFSIAVISEFETVMPTARAITPIKLHGTVRAAATELPIDRAAGDSTKLCIVSASPKSFEDAIQVGVSRAVKRRWSLPCVVQAREFPLWVRSRSNLP
jgi:hypothetical protein